MLGVSAGGGPETLGVLRIRRSRVVGHVLGLELLIAQTYTAGALDKKMPPQTRVVWFSHFSSVWNEQGLDLEMGQGVWFS